MWASNIRMKSKSLFDIIQPLSNTHLENFNAGHAERN